jgi:hypothetical protein
MTDTQQAIKSPDDQGGATAILEERVRQRCKGYTAEHDGEHGPAQLIDAALAYAMQAQDKVTEREGRGVGANPRDYWPWDPASFKVDDDELRSLAKAGALIAAAYDAAVARRAAT